MLDFINLSAYKFTPLDGLPALKNQLLSLCQNEGIKGTILLSPEGINFFVAGTRPAITALMAVLHAIPGLDDVTPKESLSEQQPYRRMLVKVKKEIIAFGVPGIDPGKRTSPKLSAKELKQWLDEGRPVTLLDTRNDYEVRLGTFRGAVPVGVDHFRDFPAAVSKLPEAMKDQPVVMFCTGGIRCEKAGPFMESVGFKQVLQLDGGILKYFEECGGGHYDGECFVFDHRVGVNAELQETDSVLCYNCTMPVTKAEQADPRYVYEKSCPSCFAGKENLKRRVIVEG